MIQHVRQKHAKGCVIACLAMVTGIPYDEVGRGFHGDRNIEGMGYHAYDVWLNERGYAVIRRYKHFSPLHADRLEVPLTPFADAHIVAVNLPCRASHAVVMDATGAVLDPNKDMPCTMADYPSVDYVAGIFKVHEPFPVESLIGLHWSNGTRKCQWCGKPSNEYEYRDPCPARDGLRTQ